VDMEHEREMLQFVLAMLWSVQCASSLLCHALLCHALLCSDAVGPAAAAAAAASAIALPARELGREYPNPPPLPKRTPSSVDVHLEI
jgi:hypothetical protein